MTVANIGLNAAIVGVEKLGWPYDNINWQRIPEWKLTASSGDGFVMVIQWRKGGERMQQIRLYDNRTADGHGPQLFLLAGELDELPTIDEVKYLLAPPMPESSRLICPGCEADLSDTPINADMLDNLCPLCGSDLGGTDD
jgi:hypothetical protein